MIALPRRSQPGSQACPSLQCSIRTAHRHRYLHVLDRDRSDPGDPVPRDLDRARMGFRRAESTLEPTTDPERDEDRIQVEILAGDLAFHDDGEVAGGDTEGP